MGETFLKGGLCVAECGAKFWEDDNGGIPQCSSCVTDCSSCNNNDTCIECDFGRYLTTVSSTCVETCIDNGGA